MQVRAISKSVKMSPRKIRLVADSIRKLSINEAFMVLTALQKRAAHPVAKTLESAVANAVNNSNLDRETLIIESVMVNEGQAMKRFHPSSRGRVHPYKKKSSHITIVLGQKVVKAQPVKPVKADEKKSADAKAMADKPAQQGQDKGGKK